MNTLLKKSAVACALVVAGIGAAHAEGLYVGGNLGTPDYKSSINGVDGGGSGLGGKLFGGYQLSPNFAVEAGFFDLGHIDDDSGKVNLRGAYIDGVGSYEFAPRWSLLGRVGLAEGRFTGSTGADSSPAFKLGAGLQYDLTRTVALRAEYEHYHFSDAFDAKPSAATYTVGLKVGF